MDITSEKNLTPLTLITKIGFLTDFYLILYEKDKKRFSKGIENVSNDLKKPLIAKYKNDSAIQSVIDIMSSSKSKNLITPNTEDVFDIKKALKFNNFTMGSAIRQKKNESMGDYFDRIKTIQLKELPEQKITPIEMTQEDKDNKSIDWLENNYAGAHGQRFLKVIDSFTVDWKTDKYEEFKKEFPDTEMKSVFHGCGSLAASMVLRFGFNVKPESKSGVIKTAGRMLGDGVYFAPNVDKVVAYCSDGCFTHRGEEIGYVFEMDVILGNRGRQNIKYTDIHYDCAGISKKSAIRSPEYCVFWHEKQIKVKKVYRVQKVGVGYTKELKNQKMGKDNEK